MKGIFFHVPLSFAKIVHLSFGYLRTLLCAITLLSKLVQYYMLKLRCEFHVYKVEKWDGKGHFKQGSKTKTNQLVISQV
jgi:hypothetical protein